MTLTARDALLADICTDPHNLDLRLVFADACEDEGDFERAEFVRVQIAIAVMDEAGEGEIDPNEGHTCWQDPCPVCTQVEWYRWLRGREQELLEIRLSAWLDDLPDGFGCSNLERRLTDRPLAHFRRGFVESVTVPTLDIWRQHGRAMVLATPLLEVRARNREPLLSANKDEWFWSTDSIAWTEHDNVLRWDVWDALRGGYISKMNGFRYYPTAHAAQSALSAALIALARAEAGLPPL